MIKKLFLLLPLTAMFIGCTSNHEGAECPVLTVEGGQIQGVVAESPGVFAYKGMPGFMIFKLDEKDAEASKMGEPIIPEPTPMPDRK